ncbi:MAG: 4Fe-4S binding protein [Oscillospiraceae bacterium]|nr:4Fe-4S binding protein [Oscillospiraceae bacterium]
MSHSITSDCMGCSACSRLCPVFAIEGERGKVHAVNQKRCVDCGVCGKACSKQAVVDASGKRVNKVPRANWAKPVINQGACSACQMCVEACTLGLIQVTLPQYRGSLEVYAQMNEPKKCVGCGLCARACPLGIIKMVGGEEK